MESLLPVLELCKGVYSQCAEQCSREGKSGGYTTGLVLPHVTRMGPIPLLNVLGLLNCKADKIIAHTYSSYYEDRGIQCILNSEDSDL